MVQRRPGSELNVVELAQPDRCSICGGPNACALSLPESERPERCWCVDATFPAELRARATTGACICRRCADEGVE